MATHTTAERRVPAVPRPTAPSRPPRPATPPPGGGTGHPGWDAPAPVYATLGPLGDPRDG